MTCLPHNFLARDRTARIFGGCEARGLSMSYYLPLESLILFCRFSTFSLDGFWGSAIAPLAAGLYFHSVELRLRNESLMWLLQVASWLATYRCHPCTPNDKLFQQNSLQMLYDVNCEGYSKVRPKSTPAKRGNYLAHKHPIVYLCRVLRR